MLDYHLAREEYEERIRKAEKAYRFSHIGKPNRLSSILSSLLSLVARF